MTDMTTHGLTIKTELNENLTLNIWEHPPQKKEPNQILVVEIRPRCSMALRTGAKPLGRQRGTARCESLEDRQGKRVTEERVMPLAAKYLSTGEKP